MVKDVQVGEQPPPFQRAPGFHHWNRYAAVNDEFVPIHMDDEAGRAAGYSSAFGMGNLQWSYLHNMLRNWMGDDGRILRLNCQFRAPNTKGQTVTAHGMVTAIRRDGDQQIVDVEIWTETQDGTKLAPGSATIALAS
jgi:acyl dehydratase